MDDLNIKLQFIVYLGQNKATTNERNEVFAVNTTDETQDASQTTAENEVSEIQGGARPKSSKRKAKKGKKRNSKDNIVPENSIQGAPNTDLKDIISMFSSKDNSELSFEELEVLIDFYLKQENSVNCHF